MLTLAGVEEIIGATLPVPSRLPALWGTVLSSDWQVKPAAKAARLQLILGGRASNRPGLITIEYEAAERRDVESTGVDPWYLVFSATAEGVTLLCTLNQRCSMDEAVAFMDGLGAEEICLLSHETLAEARLLSPATTGRDAPEGRGWREDTGIWFDERGSRVPEVNIDGGMTQLHRRPEEIQQDIGVQVPIVSAWPRRFGLLTETRYQQAVRPLGSGAAWQLLHVLWFFQGHGDGGRPHLGVSATFRLDNGEFVPHDPDRFGPWRVEAFGSQPILGADDWREFRELLRSRE